MNKMTAVNDKRKSSLLDVNNIISTLLIAAIIYLFTSINDLKETIAALNSQMAVTQHTLSNQNAKLTDINKNFEKMRNLENRVYRLELTTE